MLASARDICELCISLALAHQQLPAFAIMCKVLARSATYAPTGRPPSRLQRQKTGVGIGILGAADWSNRLSLASLDCGLYSASTTYLRRS